MSTITESKLPPRTSDAAVGSTVLSNLLGQVEDGSSSSLSDPDDRTGNEDVDDARDGEEDRSEAYDTEAETERLERTPRKQRNVLLTSSDGTLPKREGSTTDHQRREESAGVDPQQASDTTFGQTDDEDESPPSSSSSKKRKRADFETQNKSDRILERRRTAQASKSSRSPSPDDSTESPTPVAEDENQQAQTAVTKPALKQSHKKGKCKAKKTKEDEVPSKAGRATPLEQLEEPEDGGEAASSNGEDVEMEIVADREEPDIDGAAKTEEELAKKKTAMHTLSAIENCFASLRDKLFDERLAQYNEELAMLEQPTFIHPGLFLMKEVVDQRRNQKVKYEQTLLKLKLESLQRESIANKAQIHSQYMQTVGDLRDNFLSQINAEIYQTQRERRSCEADMPDYMYAFNAKRSKQIMDQTAYNEEVSLLSGVAKYVGFPAAPKIAKARSNEWEEDERAYKHKFVLEDEANNTRRSSQHNPPTLRANLSAASTFGRPLHAAEEFLQQNAWTNPQHPSHHKSRHASAFSVTPSNQKRSTGSHGSASTIPEHPTAPTSSIAPTPATEDVSGIIHTHINSAIPQNTVDTTPSRITGVPWGETPVTAARSVEQPFAVVQNEAEPDSTPLSSKLTGRESHTPGALPMPLPFMQSGGTSRASPPVRNPVIKSEDPSNIYHHSSIGHQSQASPLLSTGANGQMNCFST